MLSLKTTLREYQKPAVAKMLPTKVGALFMDMGTGKTRVAIELAAIRAAHNKIDRVAWFCPCSARDNTRREIAKHCGGYDGEFWRVVGTQSMSASDRMYLDVNQYIGEQTMVVMDESHYIKNHKAKRTHRITTMAKRAPYRLAMSGTSVSKGVVDLYSQLKFLSPKILGYNGFHSFARNHLEYHPDYPGMIVRSHNTEYLAAKMAPYVYQVKLEDCIDLPERSWQTRRFAMSDDQRAMYEKTKSEILFDVDYDDIQSYTIFRLFGALRQISCGFYNSENGTVFTDNTRLKYFLDEIEGVSGDEKMLVFCWFRYDVEQIAAALEKKGEAVHTYYGANTEKQNTSNLEEWRREGRFFVTTLSSGSEALTLNEAAYTFFYSEGFDYLGRWQAEKRNMRDGQERKVIYTSLRAFCGIDERIESNQSKKENVVESFRREIQKVRTKKMRKKLLESL